MLLLFHMQFFLRNSFWSLIPKKEEKKMKDIISDSDIFY